MEKSTATDVHHWALRAIEDLNVMLIFSKNGCSDLEQNALKRAAGGLIGRITTDILENIYAIYPDMDPLK
jgi:hypothetical protein